MPLASGPAITGKMKWPATYTRYSALGMQLSPALKSPFSFHLGCGFARKNNNNNNNKNIRNEKYANKVGMIQSPIPASFATHKSYNCEMMNF